MGLEPLVCCICPTRDRPEFLKRAIECFRAQTYHPKVIAVLNTGRPIVDHDDGTEIVSSMELSGHSIGWLRNHILGRCNVGARIPDLFAHFDDDDWSAPERLAEQIAFMQQTGADVVGYGDLPFYDMVNNRVLLYDSQMRDYAVGTSLLYKREVWARTPFPDSMVEDTTWQYNVKRSGHVIASQSSLRDGSPRLIARIHPGNTTPKQGVVYQEANEGLDKVVRTLLDCKGANVLS